MKNSRFAFKYRQSASKLHRAVGDCLRDSDIFGKHEIYQEYPVNKVNEDYKDGRHKFDWVLPGINLVIECHGIQHYKVVNFGGDVQASIEAFQEGKKRDLAKKEAALDAGYIYIVVPYNMEKKITDQKIYDLMCTGQEELARYNEEHAEEKQLKKESKQRALAAVLKEQKQQRDKETRQRHLSSKKHKEHLKKAREFRQRSYRRLKELKDGPR